MTDTACTSVATSNVLEWVSRIPIRWGDMDAMGHVNNTVYFRYMEQARIDWFNHMGFRADGSGCGPILAHVSCDFVRPLVYPGEALVRQRVLRVGRSSLDHELEICRTDEPETIYARGRAVIVWMDYDRGKSAEWPEAVRALLGPIENRVE